MAIVTVGRSATTRDLNPGVVAPPEVGPAKTKLALWLPYEELMLAVVAATYPVPFPYNNPVTAAVNPVPPTPTPTVFNTTFPAVTVKCEELNDARPKTDDEAVGIAALLASVSLPLESTLNVAT